MSQGCDRCGSPAFVESMSYFNSEILCEECEAIERLHPDYHRARAAEAEQVEKGNFRFEGIGLPAGYREWARGKKAELAASQEEPEETDDATAEIVAALKTFEEELDL